MNLNISIEHLIEQYQSQRTAYPEPFRLRIHRALSWLQHAETLMNDASIQFTKNKTRLSQTTWDKLESDWDFGFVSLWIAFNAIYARDLNLQVGQDTVAFRQFLNTICYLDKDKQIYDLVWRVFSSDIRVLVNNRYVFQPFWNYHNGLIDEAEFQQSFQAANQQVTHALSAQDTDKLLEIVFSRLYTLRNQIVHGGATWNSSANREQVQAACKFLNKILPVFLAIMMESPNREDWGKPFYPFVKEN